MIMTCACVAVSTVPTPLDTDSGHFLQEEAYPRSQALSFSERRPCWVWSLATQIPVGNKENKRGIYVLKNDSWCYIAQWKLENTIFSSKQTHMFDYFIRLPARIWGGTWPDPTRVFLSGEERAWVRGWKRPRYIWSPLSFSFRVWLNTPV